MTTRNTPRKSRTTWLVVGALAGVLAYGANLYVQGPAEANAGGGPGGMMGGPAPVSVASVIARPVTEWREFSGMFEAVSSVEVRPRVSGQITAIHFEDGAEVAVGQPLFTIDPKPYAAELARAKGAVATAEAARAHAAQEFARARTLIKSQAISRSEYDLKLATVRQAAGQLDAAQGMLASAEVNLGYTTLTAPIAGKISRAEVTVGNLVNAANAPLLASIVNLAPIYASFDVDEATFTQTVQGLTTEQLKTIPVEVSAGNGTSQWAPVAIHSFDNQLKPGSGTIRVRARVENAGKTIVPGLYARVRLGSAQPTERVLIHPNAVNTDQDRKFVLVVGEDRKATYRPVVLGTLDSGLQVVREGLKPGEVIIVSGLQRARPGSEVQPEVVDMETLKPATAADATAQPEAQPPEAAANETAAEPLAEAETKANAEPTPTHADPLPIIALPTARTTPPMATPEPQTPEATPPAAEAPAPAEKPATEATH